MEIRGTFSELVQQSLDMTERSDAEPMQLYIEDVAVVTGATAAMICNEAASRPSARSTAHEHFRYVLMLHQVQAVLQHWRDSAGREPTIDEACRAVLYFSENDADLAPGLSASSQPLVWKVGHRRGGTAS